MSLKLKEKHENKYKAGKKKKLMVFRENVQGEHLKPLKINNRQVDNKIKKPISLFPNVLGLFFFGTNKQLLDGERHML